MHFTHFAFRIWLVGPYFIYVVNLIKMGNEIVGEGSDPPRPSELIYLMLEVLFKRIFYGTFLPAWCTSPACCEIWGWGFVDGSGDRLPSQIAVTEENSSASSRLSQATSPSHIRKIRMLPLFFLRIEIEFYGDLATKKVNTCCTGIFHLLIC